MKGMRGIFFRSITSAADKWKVFKLNARLVYPRLDAILKAQGH